MFTLKPFLDSTVYSKSMNLTVSVLPEVSGSVHHLHENSGCNGTLAMVHDFPG